MGDQKAKNLEKDFSDEETARRRDELAKRMLNMPPHPLKPKPIDDATPKKHRRTRGGSQPKEEKSDGRNT